MIYYSTTTPKGNSSYSHISQENADWKAAQLDANGCFRCSNCSNCSDCSDCSNCSRCSSCSDCSYCSGCSDCSGCSGCSRCSYCSRCFDCFDCSNCSGPVIQAGYPNDWPCYGWLKEGKLYIHCGCRHKTYSEAVKYWSNKPERVEVLLAVEYIASVARSRGWEV